jgi:hypothetical protein
VRFIFVSRSNRPEHIQGNRRLSQIFFNPATICDADPVHRVYSLFPKLIGFEIVDKSLINYNCQVSVKKLSTEAEKKNDRGTPIQTHAITGVGHSPKPLAKLY